MAQKSLRDCDAMEKNLGSGYLVEPSTSISGSFDELRLDEKEYMEKAYKRNKYLIEYLRNGFSFIPLDMEKKPLISWKEYQERQPEPEEVYKWCFDYSDFNIGLITGFGGFYSLDLDTKETFNLLPAELKSSMLTETRRGFHLNFLSSKHYSSKTISINGVPVEFKGAGSYVVEPHSVINDFEYKTINPLSEIKSLPALIEDLLQGKKINNKLKNNEVKETKRWTYVGKSRCIKQILDRELEEGGRQNALFILRNLLLRNGNSEKYSYNLVIRKNRYLANPLQEKELLNLLKEKPYGKLGCDYVRTKLPYISCEGCEHYKEVLKRIDFKKALDDPSLTREDLKLIYELDVEEKTNRTQIAKELNIPRRGVYQRIDKIKKRGYNL